MYLHFVLRFWNQVLTCASVILRFLANVALSVDAKYFCLWKRFSSSHICNLENEVRGFFLLGGVRFWYGCPILLGASGPLAPPKIFICINVTHQTLTKLHKNATSIHEYLNKVGQLTPKLWSQKSSLNRQIPGNCCRKGSIRTPWQKIWWQISHVCGCSRGH